MHIRNFRDFESPHYDLVMIIVSKVLVSAWIWLTTVVVWSDNKCLGVGRKAWSMTDFQKKVMFLPAAVNCSSPASITNGFQIGTPAYSYGSTVNFSCNLGYRLQGSPNINCLANQTWSSDPPQCNGKKLTVVSSNIFFSICSISHAYENFPPTVVHTPCRSPRLAPGCLVNAC